MPTPRQGFGICAINNFIYTGGGYESMITTDRVDRFDVLRNTWDILEKCKLPNKMESHNFISVRNRFICSFGNNGGHLNHVTNIELVFRLDTFNLDQGWKEIMLNSTFARMGCQYGFLPISESRGWKDTTSFVIFGGLDELSKPMARTALIEFNNKDLNKSKMSELTSRIIIETQTQDQVQEAKEEKKEHLPTKDRFYFA